MEMTLDILEKRFPNIKFIWSSNHASFNLKPSDDMIVNLEDQAILNKDWNVTD